jgi:integrase
MSVEYYISSNKYSLQERNSKRGKVYDVMFRIVTLDGVEKQKKLSGYATKTLAKQAYMEFVTEKCELVRNNPLKKRNPQKEEPFVGDLIREYMATLGNDNKYTTVYDKNNVYRLFVLPYYENKKPKDLTTQELAGWVDNIWNLKNPRNGEYYSYKQLSKIRGHFNVFLNWLELRYGYKNNLSDVPRKKKRVAKTEMKFWTRDQFDQFIAVVDDPTYHALFTFMFYTGRRKGELFALTPQDVQAKSIKINKSLTRKTRSDSTYEITSTKAEKTQNIPVCKIVQEEIATFEGLSPFYFGGDKPLASTTVKRAFDNYCKQAGVEIIRIHDLRHSFVSMLIHLGANLMVVADLIGDTVEQVMKTYGHLYQEDKLNILSKID